MSEADLLRKRLLLAERGAAQFEAVRSVVVSMIAGVDVSGLFAEMLKVRRALGPVGSCACVRAIDDASDGLRAPQAVECNDFRQKRLIYLYLCNFSRNNQELSMMAVNTLQKDFRHANPLVRAAALKAMAALQCVGERAARRRRRAGARTRGRASERV